MDEIKGLIKVVSEYTKRNIPLLDFKNQHQNGNKEMNLFLGIKNGEFNDDAEASNGIYGSEEVDFKFRMLKSRLNRKLLNHLFFMDFESKNFAKSANCYQEALDYLHFSRMLLNVEQTSLGTKILYKAIDLAKECEYTAIVIDCLKALREVYAKTYRPKLFQNIKRQIEEYEVLERIEEKADAIFQEYHLYLNSSVNNRKKNLKPFEKAIKELEILYKSTNSYNIFEGYFKMKVWYHELKGDFENVLKFIGEVEKKYNEGNINRKRFDTLFAQFAKGNAFIKMRNFKYGSIFLEQMLNEIDHTSKAWFTFAEKYVILNIQNKRFDFASDIFFRVASNKSFNELDENELLKWNIFRSYLFFLTGNRKIIRKFNYDKFVNKTPKFSKENAGYHVALIILQIMSKSNGDLSLLHDKLNAVNDYVNRYLNNSFSKRTKTFCKLLHKIAIHNRNYDTIVQKSKYLQDKLFGSEMAGETFVDFEVVPYEFLWEKVLADVKNFKESA
ncbi:MAG: hypothetical protein MI975_17650 [Cytophagales bacterium]|nr:hypothetical protein [Cytophagales bacterium]